MKNVDRRIEIEARPEVVWKHLVDRERLAGWLMRNDFRPEKDAEFHFYAEPRGDWDGVIHCRVVEIDPPRTLSFSWNANDIGVDTIVTISLEERGGGTVVSLRHEGFEAAGSSFEEIVARHDDGWMDHLGVLALQTSETARGGQIAPGPVEWSEFALHVAIDAPPETILERWRTSGGMESFYVEMMQIADEDGTPRSPDEPARPGDRFVWRWHNGRTVSGEYLKPEGENEVRFTFGESKVSIRAEPWRGGSLVQLRQYEIPEDETSRMHIHANCRGGWVYFLTVLKILLEHGIDGRDQTRETGSSFSTYFDPHHHGLFVDGSHPSQIAAGTG